MNRSWFARFVLSIIRLYELLSFYSNDSTVLSNYPNLCPNFLQQAWFRFPIWSSSYSNASYFLNCIYIYISIYRVVYLQYKLESVFNSRPGFAGWPTIKILLLCVVCFFQDRISRGGKKTGAAGRSECRAAARREPRGRPDVHRVGERRVRGSESISAEAYSWNVDRAHR